MKTDEEIREEARRKWGTENTFTAYVEGYTSAQSTMEAEINKWAPLAKISDSPQKWLKVYAHYQDLLINEEAEDFWQEQFNIQNKLREEAEASIDRRANEKVEEWKKNLKDKLLELQAMAIRYNDHYGDAMIDNVINLLNPSEGENHE